MRATRVRSASWLGAAVVAALLSREFHGQAGTVLSEFRIGEGLGGFTGTLADDVRFGAALASLGDLDGDGLAEVAVGTPGGDNLRGALYVLFLRADGTVRSHVRIAQGVGGFTGTLTSQGKFGESLCALGDFNLDGTPDLAVGSWLAEAWILTLRPDGTVATTTRAGYGSGTSQPRALARLGDLDGDGLPELIAGEPNSGQGGSAWILYLQANGSFRTKLRIPTPHDGESGTLAPATFGSSAAPLGDLDGDGVLDLAIGDPLASDGEFHRGAVWIFFLQADGQVKSRRRLGQGARGFPVELDPEDRFGSALASQDLDLDGDLDLCICAQGDDDGFPDDRGAAWLCWLGADGRVERKHKISRTAGGFGSDLLAGFARSATFCGDLDGNGGVELMLGAPDARSPDQLSGVAWMLSLAGPSGASELPLEPLAPGAGAGRSGPRLFVVDGECGNASRIDTAIAAARDGDVIVVRAGDHAPFTIENKSLRVICEPGARTGAIVVRGLTAQREVVLRGIEGALVLEDNLGPIWIEDSVFLTIPQRVSSITRCAQVGLLDCVFWGADRFGGFCGANGGSVLRVSESTVFAYDCEWTGMAGCPATLEDGCPWFGCETTAATPGATGLTLVNSSAYLFGCTLQGGAGGAGLVYSGSCAWCPATMPAAPDGSGIARDAGSELTLMASTLSSLTGTGPTTYLGGDPSSFDVSTPVVPGEPVTLHITGTPGHEAYVLAGSPYQPAFDAARSGVAVLPPATPATFLGVLPASGSLTVVLSLNLLAGREQAEVLYHQALTVDPASGASTLGTASVLLQYRDPCR